MKFALVVGNKLEATKVTKESAQVAGQLADQRITGIPQAINVGSKYYLHWAIF
ncbi:MAG: hypothetical protein ABI675_02610 [Chitinophagaceae bacterium]